MSSLNTTTVTDLASVEVASDTSKTSRSSKSTSRAAAQKERPSVRSTKPTKTLRERVLLRSTSRRSSVSEDTTEQPPSGQIHTTSMTQSPTDIGANDIESWNTLEVPQVEFPRIDYLESEEDLSDGSSTSGQMPIGRPSYVYLTTKRTGVEMDAATKIANETLQRGKEALEAAGNMKRECKQIAIDCLQTLYETILSLSDSRSWHKFNLEKERHHHAKEIVSIERAHNKQLVTSVQEMNKKPDDT